MSFDVFASLFSGTSSTDAAQYVVDTERKRQQAISRGLTNIGSVYGGGQAYLPATSYTPGAFSRTPTWYSDKYKIGPSGQPSYTQSTDSTKPKYYTLNPKDKTRTSYMLYQPGNPLYDQAQDVDKRAQKLLERGLLFSEPTTYKGYGPDFFQKRADEYLKFARPQLAKQYKGAVENETYDLSRRGLLDSSVQEQRRSELERRTAGAKRDITDESIAQSYELENKVAQAKDAAISQLYQTSNPALATESAAQYFQNLDQPSSFAPIANYFGDLGTQYYTNKLIDEQRQYQLGYGSYDDGYGNPQYQPRDHSLPEVSYSR